MTPEAAPRTAAGRLLLEVLLAQDRVAGLTPPVNWVHGITHVEAEAAAGTALDGPVITSAELEAMTVAERTAYIHDRAVLAAAQLPPRLLEAITATAPSFDGLDADLLHRALFVTGQQIPLVDVEYAVRLYARLAGEDRK